NLSTSIGVLLRTPGSRDERPLFARVKIPSVFPHWICLENRFIRLSDIVTQFVGRLFPGMEILETLPFRITRNAEVEKDEDDAENLMTMISAERKERRFAGAVRLEYGAGKTAGISQLLKRELGLNDDDLYVCKSLDYSNFDAFLRLDRPELRFRPWR